eukprot:scpid78464/ scgid30708/ 
MIMSTLTALTCTHVGIVLCVLRGTLSASIASNEILAPGSETAVDTLDAATLNNHLEADFEDLLARNATAPDLGYEVPDDAAHRAPFRFGQPDPYCPRPSIKVCLNGMLMKCTMKRKIKMLRTPRACELPCIFSSLDVSLRSGEHFICLQRHCNTATPAAPDNCRCLKCHNGNLVAYIRRNV